jgi:hypothetical protein
VNVGDLVRMKVDVGSTFDFFKKGVVGVVIKIESTSPKVVHIRFPESEYMTSQWDEIEVISEIR